MSIFNTRTEIRNSKTIEKQIYLSLNNYPDIYMSKSHFIRVAIIKELRTRQKK